MLVSPRVPGNIGAAARAAENFGAEALRLVSPQAAPTDPEAERFATAGREILRRARVFPDLLAAVGEFPVVVATTSMRRRRRRAVEPLARTVRRLAGATRLALVFGPEDHGLTDAELDLATDWTTIPTAAAAPVLNLAQAVAIALQAFSAAPAPRVAPSSPVPLRERRAMFSELIEALAEIGFFDGDNRQLLERDLRRTLGAGLADARDVAIWRGVAHKIAGSARRGGSLYSPSAPTTSRRRRPSPR